MLTSMVQIPGWARYGWLKAAFSTRDGGATSVYGAEGEQNLGWTAEDHPVVVASNRRGLVEAVAGQQGVELVTLRQVHGAMVQVVRPEDGPLSTAEGRAVLEGDGLVTGADGLMLGVQTADCVPVLVADVRTRALGAFHAGWRGTVAGVVRGGCRDHGARVWVEGGGSDRGHWAVDRAMLFRSRRRGRGGVCRGARFAGRRGKAACGSLGGKPATAYNGGVEGRGYHGRGGVYGMQSHGSRAAEVL